MQDDPLVQYWQVCDMVNSYFLTKSIALFTETYSYSVLKIQSAVHDSKGLNAEAPSLILLSGYDVPVKFSSKNNVYIHSIMWLSALDSKASFCNCQC